MCATGWMAMALLMMVFPHSQVCLSETTARSRFWGRTDKPNLSNTGTATQTELVPHCCQHQKICSCPTHQDPEVDCQHFISHSNCPIVGASGYVLKFQVLSRPFDNSLHTTCYCTQKFCWQIIDLKTSTAAILLTNGWFFTVITFYSFSDKVCGLWPQLLV